MFLCGEDFVYAYKWACRKKLGNDQQVSAYRTKVKTKSIEGKEIKISKGPSIKKVW